MLPTVTGEFRLVTDPEIHFADSGMPYTRFRAVADKKKKVGDEWVDDKVIWVNVTAFGKYAENLAESATKGDIVMIEGTIETREYEKDSVKRTSVDIAASRVGLSFGRSKEGSTRPATAPTQAAGDNPWGPASSGEPPF